MPQLTYAVANCLAKLWQLAGPENYQHDDQDNDQVSGLKRTHVRFSGRDYSLPTGAYRGFGKAATAIFTASLARWSIADVVRRSAGQALCFSGVSAASSAKLCALSAYTGPV